MATRRLMNGGGAGLQQLAGNTGIPAGRMPQMPARPGMMGARGGAANNPRPGMPGPQAGAPGGAAGAPVPLPGQPMPSQPNAGGPLSPMNAQGSGMLQPQMPPPTPLPPWGSQPGSTGAPGAGPAGDAPGGGPGGPGGAMGAGGAAGPGIPGMPGLPGVTDGDGTDAEGGQDDAHELMGDNSKPHNPNAGESMSPIVMLRMLKALGRI